MKLIPVGVKASNHRPHLGTIVGQWFLLLSVHDGSQHYTGRRQARHQDPDVTSVSSVRLTEHGPGHHVPRLCAGRSFKHGLRHFEFLGHQRQAAVHQQPEQVKKDGQRYISNLSKRKGWSAVHQQPEQAKRLVSGVLAQCHSQESNPSNLLTTQYRHQGERALAMLLTSSPSYRFLETHSTHSRVSSRIQSTLSKQKLSKPDSKFGPLSAELHLYLCNGTLSKADTSLNRTAALVPRVSALERVDCILFITSIDLAGYEFLTFLTLIPPQPSYIQRWEKNSNIVPQLFTSIWIKFFTTIQVSRG